MKTNVSKHINSSHQRLWSQAVDHIRKAPASGQAIEFDTTVRLLLISLSIDVTPVTIACAINSALENENLFWFLARIEHELSKS